MKKTSLVINHNMNHDMLCNEPCYEGINTPIICNDSVIPDGQNNRLSKSDWWYLVNQLTEWRVFNPRAVIKKNPAAAWRVMNLCKDNCVRVPGAYFTACFRKELEKDKLLSFQKTLEKRMGL